MDASDPQSGQAQQASGVVEQRPPRHDPLREGSTGAWGVLAEFEDEEALLSTCRQLRDRGFRLWDTYTPFPIHGLDEAMGLKPTILPWLVLVGGVTGLLAGLGLCWYTNATQFDSLPYALVGYQFVTSGKPVFSLPANIPVIFEMTILFSALTTFVGMLVLNLIPRFHHPVFQAPRFRRFSNDRFFIAVERRDPAFDPQRLPGELRSLGATAVEEVEG